MAKVKRLMPLVLASGLVGFSPLARGAILERLKNGENLTVAAIGTSLTAKDWGFWFQPTGDWLNGQGFTGKVALANKGVLFIDTYQKWLDLYNSQPDHANWNRCVPDGIHPNAEGAKAIIVPSVQQALQGQLIKTGTAGHAAAAVKGPWFKQNARILFQGDSITDGERNRNDCPHLLLGQGYQFIIAEVFDDACKHAPATFWAADGVHATYSGHQLMADEWVNTVSQFFK